MNSELTLNDFDMKSIRSTATFLVPSDVKVLDIGCGTGISLLYYKLRGCEAWGVEADPNIIRFAESNDLNVKVGIFNPDDFLPKHFDYVTLDQVLEHNPDPIHTLKQISKVLKDDGKCVLTFPNRSGWGVRIFRRKWLHWHVPYHLQHFSKKSIMVALDKAGFSCESINTVTNEDWLYYQGLHLLMYPKMGHKSDYWMSTSKGLQGIRKSFYCLLLYLHKSNILRFISRQLDKLSIGDNTIVVARIANTELD